MYHDVASRPELDGAGFPGPLAARYKLEPDRFQAHLEAIAAAGARVDLLGSEAGPFIALTFDDGGSASLGTADALEERGWRGHFFVPTGLVGSPGFLGPDGVRELASRGHVVGSHSHTHPTYMGKLRHEGLGYEWARSREILGQILGKEPAIASLPGGYYSVALARAVARAGYAILMTSEPVSQVRVVDGVTVVGRYAIWSSTPAATAAAYVRGDRVARGRLRLEWSVKRVGKTLSPRAYDALRRLRARSERR
jgi:peptidoglycan/xylan/chitin deacetylase (PgdA/CDA1 family)